MQKKALFIHGLHSDSESTTGGIVAEILKEYGYETIHPTFNLLDAEQTMAQIKEIYFNEMDRRGIIAAHSLGGFYGFVFPCPAFKILINPCFEPEIHVQRLLYDGEVFPENLKEEWPALRDEEFNHYFDIEAAEATHGVFAKNDELFSYADYVRNELHFHHVHMIEGGHKPTKEQLASAIDTVIKTPVQFSPPMSLTWEDAYVLDNEQQ